jgi:hypothetical protein
MTHTRPLGPEACYASHCGQRRRWRRTLALMEIDGQSPLTSLAQPLISVENSGLGFPRLAG